MRKRDHFAHIDAKIPRVKSTGFWGNVSDWDPRNPLRSQIENTLTYGSIYAHRELFNTEVQISDPVLTREVLRKCPNRPVSHNVLKYLFGTNSIFLVRDNDWQKLRTKLETVFRRVNLDTFLPITVECTQDFISKWRTFTPKASVDMDKELIQLSITVIARTLFSRQSLPGVIDHVNGLINAVTRVLGNPIRLLDPRNPYQIYKCQHEIREYFRKIRQEHKAVEGKTDIVTSLTEYDPETVVDQMMSFFYAGHDTVGHTLAWTLYEVSMRPDVQTKILEEVDSIKEINRETIGNVEGGLKYLNSVIREVLRLHPPASVQDREVPEDMDIGEYHFTKGTDIRINLWSMHLSAEHWPDPHRFSPERWNDVVNVDASWLPFNTGPRVCIGRDFALQELRVALCLIYKTFTFTHDTLHVVGPESKFTTLPTEGLYMWINKRK